MSEKHRREEREWKKRASANATEGLFSSGSSFNPSNLLLATRAAPVSTGLSIIFFNSVGPYSVSPGIRIAAFFIQFFRYVETYRFKVY